MSIIAIGDKVVASYKTGEYIGEVVDLSERKAAVKVLAVLKHPEQGDLHDPHSADVPFFHQRRALAHREIALMPLPTVIFYEGHVPGYEESLKAALEAEIKEMRDRIAFAEKALKELEELRADYFREKKQLKTGGKEA